MGLSRMSSRCRECPFRDTCQNKRMEGLMYYPEKNMAASAAEAISANIAETVAVKHDYRDIKIAEGMTVTIDLEEIKKRMAQDFYKSIGLPGV